MLESWEPALPETGRPSPAPASEGWTLILRSDNVELSEGFQVYLRHFLAMHEPKVDGGTDRLLGISLGAAGCGSVYAAEPWNELRRFAFERLGLESGVLCDEKGGHVHAADMANPQLDWEGVEKQFLTERGYTLHYPGLNLCRGRGDISTPLASGEDVAALLRRRAAVGGRAGGV